MSAFLTGFFTQLVDDLACSGRGIWRFDKPFRYSSDILGTTITIEPGFLTDYASVPRVPFAYWLFGDSAHAASALHDWLYHHHEVCSEQTANEVFLEACIVTGIPKWRRACLYMGVAVGGKSSWEADGSGDGHSIVDGRIV